MFLFFNSKKSKVHWFRLGILILSIHFTQLESQNILGKPCQKMTTMIEMSECIVTRHPDFQLEEIKLKEISGRKKIASYFFPSNPNVSGYLANRNEETATSLFGSSSSSASNFQVMVNQEIYTNGKREIAIQIADEEFRAQVFRLETVKRILTFEALKKIIRFHYLFLEKENSLNSLNLVKELKKVSKARINEGLSPGIDESLSESEEIRIFKIWNQTHRQYENAKSELEVLLGIQIESSDFETFQMKLPNSFPKDKTELVKTAFQYRPEVFLTEKEIEIALLRHNEVRKQKIPNVSLGAFAQNDGFNERVVGGMISLPLILWRDFEGESIISASKIDSTKVIQESVARNIKQEVLFALTNFLTLSEEINLYDENKMERAESDLKNLQEAIRFGKIKIIDAINHQRILLQTKLNYLNTKSEYEVSQIELIRVLGLPTDILEIRP
ncbi:TolC related protein [Leptospira biflexa serovar Patoc strain 'Patoc 1 (Ames)']|uniref:Putative efflux system outer membrane protein CzcC n=1 Tax=Leptospira biflexa serovar Patoc (strain Patoc 1 / ATCC 23582 / Paris) TaxID=456481 RepID=B0SQ13_LEPBP|nr:TolC family protein [Leptospira biflexa]ABZ95460.1 TolC related protein [Leptospira biflexa serovar Patoc strain 'Patoc 1 (Ames)']ABZ99165.1 Putative efflux system outer membrane protein CzcC [Leptospira biflexa serovar Patoc strain 'Patoc 1 (Paris)']